MRRQDTVTTEEQLQREVSKLGQREFRSSLARAARQALSQFPTESELDGISPAGRAMLQRMYTLAERCSHLEDLQDSQSLAALAGELGWAKRIMDVAVAYMMEQPGGGSGGGKTCATKCLEEYNRCIDEHNCDDSGWICICCTPCSLQYMGCMAKCITFRGSEGLFGFVSA